MAAPTTIEVEGRGGDRYELTVRGHRVLVDQPVADGGEDTAPTPTELFVAGLAGCVAFYAGRFLRRHGLSEEGLGVSCRFELSDDRPARVAWIEIEVTPPAGFPEDRLERFRAVVEHCTVHNSLRQAPEVRLSVVSAGDRAA